MKWLLFTGGTGGVVHIILLALVSVPRLTAAGEPLACTCECCVAELQREGSEDGGRQLQCMQVQTGLDYRSPFRAPAKECGDLCQSESGERLDSQQFCFAECVPRDLDAEHLAQQGSPCSLPKYVGRGGTVAPVLRGQLEVQQAHLFLANASIMATGLEGASESGVPPPAAAHTTGAMEQKLTQIAQETAGVAALYAEVARGPAVEIANASAGALQALGTAAAAVEKAQHAAEEAEGAERRMRVLRDEILKATRYAAFRLIPEVLKPIVQKARRQTRGEAEGKARVLEVKILEEAPEAARKAAGPYKEAAHHFAAVAKEYLLKGRALDEQSQAMRTEAEALQRQASVARSALEAQQVMQKANALAGEAARTGSQADWFFKASESLLKVQVPGYLRQSQQAAYHAEASVDPNAQPPLPPIV
mmetsp:Transcript_16921/g.39788  ORF Transcript_16921/g.39788 Transcript_16921/m.39788 type:complete len:420 (-) Transcript_16921:199-1458(-)